LFDVAEPRDPRVEQAWLYALADARRETKVAIPMAFG